MSTFFMYFALSFSNLLDAGTYCGILSYLQASQTSPSGATGWQTGSSGRPDSLQGHPDRPSGQPDRLAGRPDRPPGWPDRRPRWPQRMHTSFRNVRITFPMTRHRQRTTACSYVRTTSTHNRHDDRNGDRNFDEIMTKL